MDTTYLHDEQCFDALLATYGGKLVPVYLGRLRSQPGVPIPASQVRYGITSSLLQAGETDLLYGWQFWNGDDDGLAMPDARAVHEVSKRLQQLNRLLGSHQHFAPGKREELKSERQMLIGYLQARSHEDSALQQLKQDYRYLKTILSRFAHRLYKVNPRSAEYFLSHLQTGLYFMWIPDY